MNKNKVILIIILTILGLAIIYGLFSLFTSSNPASVTTPTAPFYPPISNPVVNPPTNNFPTQSTGTSTSQNLRDNTSYIFSDSTQKEEIKKAFDNSLNKTDYPSSVNWESYASKDRKQISLNDFASAIGIRVDSQFDKFIDPYNYDRITCKNNSGGLDYGFVVENKLFSNYPTLEEEEEKILRGWEPNILKDLHKIIFPTTNLSDQQLNQTLTFKDGKYRYAVIELPDGKKGSINYHLLVDSIVFTNSVECMDKASQEIEAIE